MFAGLFWKGANNEIQTIGNKIGKCEEEVSFLALLGKAQNRNMIAMRRHGDDEHLLLSVYGSFVIAGDKIHVPMWVIQYLSVHNQYKITTFLFASKLSHKFG